MVSTAESFIPLRRISPELNMLSVATAVNRLSVWAALMAYPPPPHTPSRPIRAASTPGKDPRKSAIPRMSSTRCAGLSVCRG